MSLTQFFNSFSLLADAPNGLRRLRELILEFAIRGKLVPQIPSEEPASQLFERILAQRVPHDEVMVARRVFESDDLRKSVQAPFNLPANWISCRLRDISTIIRGVSYKKSEASVQKLKGYIPLLRAHNINGTLNFEKLVYVPETFVNERQYIRNGDILIAMSSGSAELVGKAAQAETDICAGFGAFCGLIRITPLILKGYLKWFFQSPYYRRTVAEGGKGIGINNVQKGHIENLLLPLPPFEEQKRIVERIDELIRLCALLELQQQAKRESRARLNNATLTPFNKASSLAPEEFERTTARLTEHFETLYGSVETVGKLRSTILQLAMQGKLTRHEPTDKPVLMNCEGNSSKDYDLRVFSEFSGSIVVPHYWDIQPLIRVASAIVDCPHSTPKWTLKGKICVRTNQFRPGYLDLSKNRFVSEETYLDRIQRLKPMKDDILYSREGGILGIACRVRPDTELCLGQRMMLIRSSDVIDPAFLELVLNSPLTTEIAKAKTTGGAAPRVNVTTVKAYPIPLPPLEEQNRIVAKVNKLMTRCDDLELKLRETKAHSEKLMKAAVQYVLQTASSNAQVNDAAQ